MHIVGTESGDYAWIQAWKVEDMTWVFEPGCYIFSIDANVWHELVWMNLDEEFSYDCSIVECVTGSTVEDIGRIE